MKLHLDHTEPPVIPDTNPNRPPPMPPAPAPDVVPVRDPMRPEHPDPVKEPPTHEPPISARRRRGRFPAGGVRMRTEREVALTR